jgi:hypothetical protein
MPDVKHTYEGQHLDGFPYQLYVPGREYPLQFGYEEKELI